MSDPAAMFKTAASAVKNTLQSINQFAGNAFSEALAVTDKLAEVDFGNAGDFPDPPTPPEVEVNVTANFADYVGTIDAAPGAPDIAPADEASQISDIEKGYRVRNAPSARPSFRLNKTADQRADEQASEAAAQSSPSGDGTKFEELNPLPSVTVGFSDTPPQPLGVQNDIPDAPTQLTEADLDIPAPLELDIAEPPSIVFADLAQVSQNILDTLPAFDHAIPSPLAFPAAPQLNYIEQSYDETNLDAVTAQLSKFFNGDYAISAVLQAAMFTSVRNVAATKELKDIRAAFDEAGSRGFFEAHGELAEKVSEVQIAARTEAEQGSQAILDKAAEWQVQNFRTAVQAALALEALLVKQYSELASRSLDAAVTKANIRSEIYSMTVQAFDVALDVHRARLSFVKTQVVDRVLRVQAYAAQINAASVSDEFKSQQLRVYGQYLRNLQSQLSASRVNLNRAGIQLAQAQLEIERHGAQMQGIELRYEAKKQEINNYNLTNQVELLKLRSVDPLAKSLADTMTRLAGVGAANQRKVRDAALEEFNSNVTEQLANYDVVLQNFRDGMTLFKAKFDAFVLQRQAYKAQIDAQVSAGEIKVDGIEAQAQLAVSNYQIKASLFSSKATQLVEQAKLQVAATQAAGKVSSQLAAGAMSALNTGASLKGEGSFSATFSASSTADHSVDHGLQNNSPPIITDI